MTQPPPGTSVGSWRIFPPLDLTRATRVGEHRNTADRRNVHGRHDDLAAVRRYLGSRGIDVGHRHVPHPVWRRAHAACLFWQGHLAGNRLLAHAEHPVLLAWLSRH